MRYMITDEMWAVIEECLAQAKIEKRGRPAEIADCKFLEALPYLARTGIPWRDLPRTYFKKVHRQMRMKAMSTKARYISIFRS
jgi:transposase